MEEVATTKTRPIPMRFNAVDLKRLETLRKKYGKQTNSETFRWFLEQFEMLDERGLFPAHLAIEAAARNGG